MFRNIFCISILMMLSTNVSASIVMDITRVIYNAGMREVTIPITNRSNKPVLVQSWLDTGNKASSPASNDTPFIIIPPITRVDAESRQTLRLHVVNSSALPRDRESLFWLNVLDVPMKLPAGEGVNRLQMALQTRVKLFYRPEGLRGNPETAVQALSWHSSKQGVTVSNSGARYVSLVSVATKSGNWPVDMVAPGESRNFPLSVKSGTPAQVTWIDDNGMTKIYDVVIK